MTFGPGHAQKWKFWEFLDEKVTYVFRFFDFWIFFFAFPFSSFDLLLRYLAVKKPLRKHHRDGNFYHGAFYHGAVLAGNFGLSFSLNFLSILCISQAPLDRSLWSWHHQKDLFLLQKLSIHVDDANFGQKWWRQKWKKGQGSSRAVMDGIGDNGLISSLAKTGRHHHHSLELFYTCNETVYLLNHSISCFQIA